jgi:hypothetical protein
VHDAINLAYWCTWDGLDQTHTDRHDTRSDGRQPLRSMSMSTLEPGQRLASRGAYGARTRRHVARGKGWGTRAVHSHSMEPVQRGRRCGWYESPGGAQAPMLTSVLTWSRGAWLEPVQREQRCGWYESPGGIQAPMLTSVLTWSRGAWLGPVRRENRCGWHKALAQPRHACTLACEH